MCGSRPYPEVVTMSAGIAAPGFSASACSTSAFTRVINAAFVGPRFEAPPLEEFGSYPAGPAADGRGWKYPGELKACPIRLDPTAVPFALIISPLACRGNIRRAKAVATSG